MYLAYIDESGDDGYPLYSSQLFILTTCYFHESDFKHNFNLIKDFRKNLKDKYGLYTSLELHLRELIQNKKPYSGTGLTKIDRQNIVRDIFEFIGSNQLRVQFINVAIDKETIKNQGINILDKTLQYLIRRIENDLSKKGGDNFLCISDDGRVQMMNKTARRIRKVDFVPSKFGGASNNPIDRMIEDILEKSSKDSYFIQLCDCVSRLTYLYTLQNECSPKVPWIRKTRKFLNYGDEIKYMELIKSKLNLKAASHQYGIKYV